MANYQMYAKVSGKEIDFELKRKVESIAVLEKLAEICIDEKVDSDGLKPLLTPNVAYKYLKEGKGYRWFKQRYNCTKHQINGYKRWLEKNPATVGEDEEIVEYSGIDLYAKLNGGNVCIELRGKVASLDSVLKQIISEVSVKVDNPVSSHEAAKPVSDKPELSYKEFKKNYGKSNSWFIENYHTTGLKLSGYRVAYKRHNKEPKKQSKESKSKKSKKKQELTRDIAVKFLNKGKDFDWFSERYNCTIMQLAGYKAWLSKNKGR